MIEMKCPECGHQLRIKAKYAGKRGGCKSCRATFIVPEASAPRRFEDEDEPADFTFDMLRETPVPPAPPPEEAGPAKFGKFGPGDKDKRVFEVGGLTSDPAPAKVEEEEVTAQPLSLSQIDKMPEPVVEGRDTVVTLGPIFWTLAFFLPPVAFIWSLFVPKDHPHRLPGMITSIVFNLIAVSIFCGMYFGLGDKVVEFQEHIRALNAGEGWGEEYGEGYGEIEGQGEQFFVPDP